MNSVTATMAKLASTSGIVVMKYTRLIYGRRIKGEFMASQRFKDFLFKTNLDVIDDLIPRFTSTDRKRNEISPQSDYSVFFDENGDTYLDHVIQACKDNIEMGKPEELDNSKRYFCLTAVVMRNKDYKKAIEDNIDLKTKYWPSLPSLVFHSREIRRKEGPFRILDNKIIGEMSTYIEQQNFKIFYCFIDKYKLVSNYFYPLSPYYISMGFILERLIHPCNFASNAKFELILESRGRKEDNQLLHDTIGLIIKKKVNYRICGIYFNHKTDKQHHPEVGLELADLCSYPLYSHHCNGAEGRDYQIVKQKLHQHGCILFPK